MVGVPRDDDFAAWVRQLADPSRASRSYWHLVLSGAPAREFVQRGLDSADTAVRRWCAKAMDHLVDEDGLDALVGLLDDPDPRVRVEACHALACDRCKENGCVPDSAVVLPRAIQLVRHDPDRHVRSYAIEVVGRWVHTHAEAEAALVHARDHDPAAAVRKKASWYAPGGTIHRRTTPRPRPARGPR